MFFSESDVRQWVREASKNKARWVEPTIGATAGLPDCWVPWERNCVHLELKIAHIEAGCLRFKVRPEQVREHRAMVLDGVVSGLLVGIKGTPELFFLPPDDENLAGKYPFDTIKQDIKHKQVAMNEVGGFWAGVNFIFLNSR